MLCDHGTMRRLPMVLVSTLTASCSISYEATNGMRYADANEALQASVAHDLPNCDEPADVEPIAGTPVGRGRRDEDVTAWSVSACGRSIVYTKVAWRPGVWKISAP